MNSIINYRPIISIIVPVLNSRQYITKAIESVISQDFQNFELIIIDDNSNDGSVEILKEYAKKDIRIKLIVNNTQLGLAKSLLTGISVARGEFIARMDADDICVPERLSKQIAFLQSHHECDVVCSCIACIDENGHHKGEWEIDRKTIQPQKIMNTLTVENCIAHPTIFTKREIFLHYSYNPSDKDAEDYGLWLRLAADGYHFCKIPEPLLYYRIHKKSITSLSKTKNPYKKVINVKIRFLKERITHGKFSLFECRVAFYLINDIFSSIKFSLNKQDEMK